MACHSRSAQRRIAWVDLLQQVVAHDKGRGAAGHRGAGDAGRSVRMEEGPMNMDVVEIKEESIALFKLLKLANLVASGGEAKYVVSEGLVRVNGAVEEKKGKKIKPGDIVEFQGERIQVANG